MTIRRHIDLELLLLQRMLFEMAELVDAQLSDAIDALLHRDVALAEKVRARDDEVDAYELKIDRQCERILALHHPVAAELRMIITAVKVNTDLERIGDHCKNMAKNTPHVVEAPEALAQTRLEEMADASREMLRQVQEAFVNRPLAQGELCPTGAVWTTTPGAYRGCCPPDHGQQGAGAHF